jgi:hypothetical protein
MEIFGMKPIFVIALIALCSCNSQSRQSMQREYDSIVKQQEFDKATIEAFGPIIRHPETDKDYQMIRTVDSLKMDNERLEKKRQSLAGKLFN